MTIEKRGNSFRITQMVDGVRYRITLDHKPSQAEALKLIAKEIESNTISEDMPFSRACDLYIESKCNVLSPSSIRGYRGLMKQLSPNFMKTKLSAMSLPVVQTEINQYTVGRSPKSVRNMSGFIMGVLKYYGIQIQSPKLPQKEKKIPYLPTIEEVARIMQASKGSKYEVALYLCGKGLRRSEVCACTPQDIKGNLLTVNKALVQDEHEQWQIKSTKTTDSTRIIELDADIVEIINKQGFVYDGYPSSINNYLHSLQDSLGIERFSLHKLRHFFASYLHYIGFVDKAIQGGGGWKSSKVLDDHYKQAMEEEKARHEIAEAMSKVLR